MPVLKNPKHERFAQALAKGETADEAYVTAGYTENRGNAARLKANEGVLKRVEEIQKRVSERTEVTLESVTHELQKVAEWASKMQGPAAAQAVRQCHMDIAKLHGLVVEKRENKNTIVDLTDDAIEQRIRQLREALGEGGEAGNDPVARGARAAPTAH